MEQTSTSILSEQYVIDLSKPWHVAWWAKTFGVSEQLLCAAVILVGDHADVVRNYLQRQQRTSIKRNWATAAQSSLRKRLHPPHGGRLQ